MLKNPTSLRFLKKIALEFSEGGRNIEVFFSLSFFKSVKKTPLFYLCIFATTVLHIERKPGGFYSMLLVLLIVAHNYSDTGQEIKDVCDVFSRNG